MGQRGEGKGTLRTFIFSFIIGGNENGDVGLQICFEYGQDIGVLPYGAVYAHTVRTQATRAAKGFPLHNTVCI